MELKGEYRIPAPRAQVWAMLNDPAVLRECLPGCESLEGSPGEGFSARVTTRIGPVKATFNGAVALSNVNAPESYTISGEGKGGVAGFAKGGADVRLSEEGADTLLTYVANAQVGGKLAQLGSRLIDSTAKKPADQFFACFAQKAGAPASSGAATAPAAAAPALSAPGDLPDGPRWPDGSDGADAAALPIGDAAVLDASAANSASVDVATASAAATPRGVDMSPLHHGSATAPPPPATAASNAPGAAIGALAREAEEEIEREAAAGFLGGPIVWALLLLMGLLFVYMIAS